MTPERRAWCALIAGAAACAAIGVVTALYVERILRG